MIEQRSEEWFAQRKNRVTGSVAGAILGMSPWMKPNDVMLTMLGHKKFEGNAATEYGTFHEEYALADFPHQRSIQPVGFVVHPDFDWLGASPDGLIGDNAVLEIKCPFGLRNEENPQFKSIDEQDHYYAQIQIEMSCTGREICYFYQWNRFDSKLEIVHIDPEWLEENIPKLHAFYLEFEERKTETHEDLVAEYEAAKLAAAEAADRLDAVKEAIIALGKSTVGRLKVIEVERKGNINYSKIPELEGLDLEKYRGKSSKFWKIS